MNIPKIRLEKFSQTVNAGELVLVFPVCVPNIRISQDWSGAYHYPGFAKSALDAPYDRIILVLIEVFDSLEPYNGVIVGPRETLGNRIDYPMSDLWMVMQAMGVSYSSRVLVYGIDVPSYGGVEVAREEAVAAEQVEDSTILGHVKTREHTTFEPEKVLGPVIVQVNPMVKPRRRVATGLVSGMEQLPIVQAVDRQASVGQNLGDNDVESMLSQESPGPADSELDSPRKAHLVWSLLSVHEVLRPRWL